VGQRIQEFWDEVRSALKTRMKYLLTMGLSDVISSGTKELTQLNTASGSLPMDPFPRPVFLLE